MTLQSMKFNMYLLLNDDNILKKSNQFNLHHQ